MDPVHYTYIPVSIALGLEIAFPYLHNLACLDTWITPPLILCKAVFILVNVVFGVLLWQSLKGERDEKLLFSFIWVLFAVNISWIYFYKKNKKLSLFLLFLSLLFGYFVYNSLFLSDITNRTLLSDTTTPLYLDLFSIYIIWVGLMITVLIESSGKDFKKDFLLQKKKKKSN